MGIPAGRRAVRVCGPGVVDAARVVMAAALWREVAAEVGGLGRDDTLRQLEACAHVPARLVVAVASSLTIARVRRQASVGFEKQNCSVRVLTGLPNGSSSKWKV
jgi:hypothetical protein